MVDGIMPTGGSQHLLKRNIYGRTGGYDACGQLSRQLTSPIKSFLSRGDLICQSRADYDDIQLLGEN